MDKNNNKYIILYSTTIVIIVATLLTIVAVGLKPKQEYNKKVEKMQNILASINITSTPESAEKLFNNYIISSLTIDTKNNIINSSKAFDINIEIESKKAPEKRILPIFIAKTPDNKTKYILSLYGKGLWGPIWGYIALDDDKNTIYGTFFDHKSETPGLGAEINTIEFQKQFIGKKLFDDNLNFISIKTIKGGADKNNQHQVDAISGATITSNGVSDMLFSEIKLYELFLKSKN